MRSRYSAYAKGLVDYIVKTTDPQGPHWRSDQEAWRAEIRRFCAETTFEGLTILEAEVLNSVCATVSFRAHLSRGGEDVSFAEKSQFRRVDDCWLYSSGEPVAN